MPLFDHVELVLKNKRFAALEERLSSCFSIIRLLFYWGLRFFFLLPFVLNPKH